MNRTGDITTDPAEMQMLSWNTTNTFTQLRRIGSIPQKPQMTHNHPV